MVVIGCGQVPASKPSETAKTDQQPPAPAPTARKPVSVAPDHHARPDSYQHPLQKDEAAPETHPEDNPVATRAEPTSNPPFQQPGPRLLGDLLNQIPDAASRMLPGVPRVRVDETRARAEGIRKIAGEHLALYTDLPPSEAVDTLAKVFDQAFPQWCAYFGVDAQEHATWSMTGFIMKDKTRFTRVGLVPGDLPLFEHGYARNYDLWMFEQPSDYYRRHLLLHEGTHGFMNTLLGSCGPPWYMEGVAELLATHQWRDGRLKLGYFPSRREELPMWGRIKMVQDAYEARQAKPFDQVLDFRPDVFLEYRAYGWVWAVAALLDGDSRYRRLFRQLPREVLSQGFTEQFRARLADNAPELHDQWQVFIADLEYGYDFDRSAVDFSPGKPLHPTGASVEIAADRGWQNTGLLLEGGENYRLQATGRYQVADEPQIWWCEPGGVSIRYYDGRPLGMLLAAVRPEEPVSPCPLIHPQEVGLGATLSPNLSGTLFLKINDSAGELHDNAGRLMVKIRPE